MRTTTQETREYEVGYQADAVRAGRIDYRGIVYSNRAVFAETALYPTPREALMAATSAADRLRGAPAA